MKMKGSGVGLPCSLKDKCGQSKLFSSIVKHPLNRAIQWYHCDGKNKKGNSFPFQI